MELYHQRAALLMSPFGDGSRSETTPKFQKTKKTQTIVFLYIRKKTTEIMHFLMKNIASFRKSRIFAPAFGTVAQLV